MPVNPNMVAIQTVTVGAGGLASFTFSNIPQTYTDLVVKLSNRAGTGNYIFRLNSNSSAVYDNKTLRNADGAVDIYGSGTNATEFYFQAGTNSATQTASSFGNVEFCIPNYTSSNFKTVSFDGVGANNGTGIIQNLMAGVWRNTSAVTSITITGSGDVFGQYSTATLYGVTSAAVGAKATGGIITSDANYYYHTFLASGTFTPSSNLTGDYLVVAGGGGSGKDYSGGGGAGGLRCTVTATGGGGVLELPASFTNGTAYTITVGAGGAGGNTIPGNNGSNSSISGSGFTTITSTGGGYGATLTNSPGNGGSGGGAATTSASQNGGTGTANQGYAGGTGYGTTNFFRTGGGGGAGAVGGNGNSSNSIGISGNGGNGVATIISGTSTYYAGGGGGGGYTPYAVAAGTGGLGGGGNGTAVDAGIGTAGTANTGGGAGGSGGNNGFGASGGSGIVIIRYAK
jgi:hypothetical protein